MLQIEIKTRDNLNVLRFITFSGKRLVRWLNCKKQPMFMRWRARTTIEGVEDATIDNGDLKLSGDAFHQLFALST